jgi:hypothetical protein
MKARRFVSLVTLLLLTTGRAADIGVTLHFDPLLQREGNPIVLVFRGGVGILVSSTIIVWFLCVALIILFWRSTGLKLLRPPRSLLEFVRIWLQRVVRSRHPIFKSLPGGSHWNEGLQAIRFFGLALPWAIICVSAAAIHAWVATSLPTRIGTYQYLYSGAHVGRVNYLVWLVTPFGFLVGAIIFFLSEYYCLRNPNPSRYATKF